jgi:hypothetical protein
VATSWFAGPLVSSAIIEKRSAIFRKEETLPRKDILSMFGITDRPDLRVHIVGKPDGPSMFDVHGPGDPLKTITPKQAAELSTLLRDAGEEALGQEIATAATEAQSINRSRAT